MSSKSKYSNKILKILSEKTAISLPELTNSICQQATNSRILEKVLNSAQDFWKRY